MWIVVSGTIEQCPKLYKILGSSLSIALSMPWICVGLFMEGLLRDQHAMVVDILVDE